MTETNGGNAKEAETQSLDETLSHKDQQQLLPLRVETPSVSDPTKQRRRRRRRCCCFSCVAAVIILAIIIVVLALTVFKAKNPKISLNSVAIGDLSTNLDLAKLKLHINLTLTADMSLKNPNKAASFKHGNSTTLMFYRGKTVGQAVMPAGTIKADRTVRMNVSVTVFVDAFVSSASDLITDGLAGSLDMTTRTEIAGRVHLLHIIKKHVKVLASCDINVNVSTKSAEVQRCSKSFKL